MSLPEQLLLSDLLRHRVRCDQGLDHGVGVMAWMHPPVHRLLGWVSRPSALRNTRAVWRLDQCRGFDDQQVFVKGGPSETDQLTLERLPTLLDADLLDADGMRLGQVADLAYVPSTGEILHYLVSRSDPRLPGSSRWRLTPDRIVDQQPGLVSTGLRDLDDLPQARASVRQDFVRRSRQWREQLQHFGDRAGERLEGWLEEPPWDEQPSRRESDQPGRDFQSVDPDPLEDWDDDDWTEQQPYVRGRRSAESDGDPWI
ncbi:RNA methyltransferase [Synechococcus sp. MIT S9503]|uniref:RNA methyltransferase n=1 Tax=Synechococcus sp. MIT S9503 TaxID=3082547 RepID=UPI0039A46EF6